MVRAFVRGLLGSKICILSTPTSHFGTLGLQVGALGRPRGHQSGERQTFNEFWVPSGCPVGPLDAFRFVMIFECFFVWALGVTLGTFWTPKGSQRMPTETILQRFGSASGNVNILVSVILLEFDGVPRGVLWSMVCAIFFYTLLRTSFSDFCYDSGSE